VNGTLALAAYGLFLVAFAWAMFNGLIGAPFYPWRFPLVVGLLASAGLLLVAGITLA
jgi:hypothetical protein